MATIVGALFVLDHVIADIDARWGITAGIIGLVTGLVWGLVYYRSGESEEAEIVSPLSASSSNASGRKWLSMAPILLLPVWTVVMLASTWWFTR